VIALLLAAVAAFSVWRYLTTIEDDITKDNEEVEVFRATAPIATGASGAEAEALIEPSTALLKNVVFENSRILCTGPVVKDGQDIDPAVCNANPSNLEELLEGAVAAGPISQGQLITQDMFVAPAELNSVSLSESIPQGKVAISIRPNDVASSGGFIRPGDRVNLLASANIDLSGSIDLLRDPELRELLLGAGFGQGDEGTTTGTPIEGEVTPEEDLLNRRIETIPSTIEFTQTVMQDLEVLAVGADTRPSPLGTGLEPQGGQIIVLEVTPEQAEKIEFARQYTSIALSLLPDPEQFPYTEFEARGVVTDDLFDVITRIQELLEPVEGLIDN
jgi:Flp pilus assembly protein CpaB